jgi:hypothetical protein
MAMQTDVLASAVRVTDGLLADQAGNTLGRNRIKAVYIVPDTGAGSVVFRDGGASGSVKMTINTLASSTTPDYILIPGEGLLFQTDIYVDLTSVVSVMVFYG